MTEIKPCPFEKAGEHHHVYIDETRPGHGYIWCSDCDFAFPYEKEPKIEQLIERWNTRAERTCTKEQATKINGEPDYGWYKCSNCSSGIPAGSRYCPGCGAKVVSE